MAVSIAVGHLEYTFGCGHVTLPVEGMYPSIDGFVGFHSMIELPLTFFTHIVGEKVIYQFLFLERAEGFGKEIMKSYDFDPNVVVFTLKAYVTFIGMPIATVAEILADRGIKLFIHPSHKLPGDTTARERLDSALKEYKKRVAGV